MDNIDYIAEDLLDETVLTDLFSDPTLPKYIKEKNDQKEKLEQERNRIAAQESKQKPT